MKGSFLSRMKGWVGQATHAGQGIATDLSKRVGEAVHETGSADVNPLSDSTVHVHVAKSIAKSGLKKIRSFMKGTDKTGSETSTEKKQDDVRATGQAVGSGISHFLTGYAAGPLLYPKKAPFASVHPHVLKGMVDEATYGKEMGRRSQGFFKKHYGVHALKPAIALTASAMVGGYLKERLQAGYERAHMGKKASEGCEEVAAVAGEGGGETMRVSGNVTAPDWVKKERRRSSGHEKKAAGIFVYQRDPSEVKETKHPGKPKGPTKAFGTRMSPRHAIHKRDQEKAEDWMKGNAEFVELGDRPGLVESFQTIVGTEKEQVLTRRDAQKLLGERDRIKLLCKEQRHGAKKGQGECNPNTERDLLEVLDSVETILENPKVQAIQVVER